MKIEEINVEETIEVTRKLLQEDPNVSPALKSSFELLLLLITLLLNKLGINSSNSSKPPSSDPNRKKEKKKNNGNKKGGQKGHQGTTLQKVDDPDIIKKIEVDRVVLPDGEYKAVGFETRQVIDLDISKVVTEYKAEILEDSNGKRYTAKFPAGIIRPVQYGINVKAHSVYMSQYQLIPYNRIEEYFHDQAGIPISAGSIFNFNKDACKKLEPFEEILKSKLKESDLNHTDETGINIDGKRLWLHCVSNEYFTYFYPHGKRGFDAIEEMDILPAFKGILCHDHWKPYFRLDCLHALCNAHHLRELTRAWEQDEQKWARDVRELLLEINKAVDDAGGQLSITDSMNFRTRYRDFLKKGENECPPPDETERKKGQRGRLKRSKARNLLERLVDFEEETLRFMDDKKVPFTNNQGENDIRMTKVHQKISGCFRSMEGAKIFCRVRSYISTCKKNGVRASEAMRLLFEGELPEFLKK
jgi:transposase